MPVTLSSLSRLAELAFDEVIDARSPLEFAEDRLPGAVSMPVLSDEERARVGTLYKQVSAFEARKVGAALVARNVARHIEERLMSRDGGYRPLVYCWRGGQRSGAFATILRQVGWRAETVEGGYKAYRALVVDALYKQDFPSRVILLAGDTGTAKTAVLARLSARGVQTIDLEGLANHRGSLFGSRGAQPSQKGFETALAAAAAALDPARPVVVEAESSKVGDRSVPVSLWRAMRAAPSVTLTAPLAARAAYTAGAYREITADRAELSRLIGRLRPYHARERLQAWQAMAEEGAFEALSAELMARHYDPRYAKQREANEGRRLGRVDLPDLSPASLDAAAGRIAEIVNAV